MKELKIKIIGTLILAIMILSSIPVITQASGSFSASISKTNVTVGDTFTVKVTANGAAGTYNVSTSNSNASITSTQSGFLDNSSETWTFKANKAGTVTITAKTTDMTDNDDDTKSVTGTKTFTVTIKEATDSNATNTDTTSNNNNTPTTPTTPTKSNNAYLKTLGVRISDSLAKELGVKTDEYDFTGFSKTKTSYNVTVPKNVDSLKVVATAGENGTVKVSGNSGFEVGSNNKITVTVTSENGKTTKTYTIKVTQLAEEEEKPGNVIEDDNGLYLTSLSIEGLELSPEFAKDTYSYTATLSDSSMSEVKVNAVANKEKAKIDISGNTNLVEGENTINLVLTLDGSTEQTVYQIVLTKEGESLVATTTKLENSPTSNNDLMGTIKKYIKVAIAVVILVILAIIVLIILLRKENKRLQKEENNTEDKERGEYNVYKNNLNEFEEKDSHEERKNEKGKHF